MKSCPKCCARHEDEVLSCDCGYDFLSKQQRITASDVKIAKTETSMPLDKCASAPRLERMSVLTGGVRPAKSFELERVFMVRGPDIGSYLVEVADLVFCDVGILVVKYGGFSSGGSGIRSLIGGLGLAVSAAVVEHQQCDAALKAYESLSPKHRTLEPAERFETCVNSWFYPADEVKALSLKGDGLAFLFRGQQHTVMPANLGSDALKTWASSAAAKRRSLDGGPQDGGLEALCEWAQRPMGDPPEWVTETARTIRGSGATSGEGLFGEKKTLLDRLKHSRSPVLIALADELADELAGKVAVKAGALIRYGLIAAAVGVLGIIYSLIAARPGDLSGASVWLLGGAITVLIGLWRRKHASSGFARAQQGGARAGEDVEDEHRRGVG